LARAFSTRFRNVRCWSDEAPSYGWGSCEELEIGVAGAIVVSSGMVSSSSGATFHRDDSITAILCRREDFDRLAFARLST
jgi:hypothetical protein